MLPRLRLIILFSLISTVSFAQLFGRNSWKRQRREVYFGGGVSNFLGDLGGKDRIGTDYSYADLELKLTRPSLTFGYRYRLSKKWAWRNDFCYMAVSGDDALTREPARHNRNLSFKSNIYEVSTNIEYAFFFDKGGNRYALRSTFKNRYKSSSLYFYVSGGVGAFFFNPKSQYNGVWYALQPLGTEGQGLDGEPAKYKRFSIAIPMAFGVRASIARYYTVGLEYNFRKTFTDYIDDVHGVYYDNNAIKSARGNIAAYFADPSLGEIPNATRPDGYGFPAQRGDKQMDSYMAVELKLGIILKNKPKRRNTRAKF